MVRALNKFPRLEVQTSVPALLHAGLSSLSMSCPSFHQHLVKHSIAMSVSLLQGGSLAAVEQWRAAKAFVRPSTVPPKQSFVSPG